MNNIATISSTSTEPLPESWIEKMFDRMLLDYGKKFTDQWSGADPDKLIAHWAAEMASYTGPEIKRGLAAMATRDWPPSLPEFKKMCRPQVSDTAAYYEAISGIQARDKGEMGTWSHPAIYWAAVRMAFDLKSMTYSQIKDRWNKALQDEMEKGEWAVIPEPVLALPEPDKSDLSREKAEQMLTELGAGDVLKPKINQKVWIERIENRMKRGDKTLSAYQIHEAKRGRAV